MSNAMYGIGVMLMCISAVGIILNSLILFIIIRSLKARKEASSFHILVINLALYDLALAICGVVFRGPGLINSEYFRYNDVTMALCKVMAIVIPTLPYGSSLMVVCVTINRSFAITRPLSYRTYMSNRTSAFMCVSVLAVMVVFILVSVGIAEFSTLITLEYDDGAGRCAISNTPWGSSYVLVCNSIFFAAPFVVTLVLYMHILWHLSTGRRDSTSTPAPASSITKTHKERIFINITLLLVLYFISWSPYYILQVNMALGNQASTTIQRITFLLFYLNLVFDPLVYTLHLPSVQSTCNRWLGALLGVPRAVHDGVVSFNPSAGTSRDDERARQPTITSDNKV